MESEPIHCHKASNFPEPAGLSTSLTEPVNTPDPTVVEVTDDDGVVEVVEVVNAVDEVVVEEALIVEDPEVEAPSDARIFIVYVPGANEIPSPHTFESTESVALATS